MLFLVAIAIGIAWVVWGNTALELNEYEIKSETLPERFDGFRIVHLSDVHNTEIGKGNSVLLDLIEKAEPDIIVITGDVMDSYNTNLEVALQLIDKAVKIAPCYYVTGNHESRLSKEEYLDFEKQMISYGVNVLHNEEVFLEREGEHILLAGLDDPTFSLYHKETKYVHISGIVEKLYSEEGYRILLSHRPDLFESYVDAEVDLVFSGHAHGGQFRLPLIGGLIAPNQGFFPKYDAGLFVEEDTQMIISRGIGNSIIPVRFNNRPEVIVVELRKE